MKTPATPKSSATKPARDNRISYFQTFYSPAALAIMEAATGQRTIQLAPPTPVAPKVPVQAVDAE